MLWISCLLMRCSLPSVSGDRLSRIWSNIRKRATTILTSIVDSHEILLQLLFSDNVKMISQLPPGWLPRASPPDSSVANYNLRPDYIIVFYYPIRSYAAIFLPSNCGHCALYFLSDERGQQAAYGKIQFIPLVSPAERSFSNIFRTCLRCTVDDRSSRYAVGFFWRWLGLPLNLNAARWRTALEMARQY